jgi:hypothetical protein
MARIIERGPRTVFWHDTADLSAYPCKEQWLFGDVERIGNEALTNLQRAGHLSGDYGFRIEKLNIYSINDREPYSEMLHGWFVWLVLGDHPLLVSPLRDIWGLTPIHPLWLPARQHMYVRLIPYNAKPIGRVRVVLHGTDLQEAES